MKSGFAFLEYERADDADYAIRKLDGMNLEGMRISVQHAKEAPMRGPPGGSGYRLLATNLDGHTSWQDLKDFARKAGRVIYTDVFSNRGEKAGIIEYASRDDMDEALHHLDGENLHGSRVRLRREGDKGSRSRSPRRRSRCAS